MKRRTGFGRYESLTFFLTVIVCYIALAGPLWAGAQGGNLVFILDGSGSMWAQIEGKAKIDIAKEVLTGLIKDLPAGVDVGLVTYGHRSKGDCDDVEELAPLGPPDKEDLIKKVKAVSPKGMTPITLSVRMTAEKLKTVEEGTTILLVSDGEETCKGDPCALVRELKESGIKFVMHVIGFAVTEKEKAQLECLAKEGGGRYFSAKNANEFQMASRKVAESVTVGEEPGKLKLGKQVYLPLEKVAVSFTARPDYADSAWIGLIPSKVPHTESDADANDIAYEYLKKRTSGEMVFLAPREEGFYDLRMFNTDTGGKEMASITFEVKGNLGMGLLKVDKKVFAPGETVNLQFTAGERFTNNAWVGLFKSDLPHAKSGPSDQHDLTYQYLSGRPNGTLAFKAPYEKGSYDFRLFDTSDKDGQEAGSVTFTVAGEVAGGQLRLEKNTFKPAEAVRLSFKGSPNYQNGAWIGLVPADVPHGKSGDADQHDINYQYLSGKLEGTMDFRAPAKAGSYDFRMFNDSNSDARETATVNFTVAGEMDKGSMKPDKSVYKPEEKIKVTFTASPDYRTDAWIGIIPSDVPHGDESVNDSHDVDYRYLSGATSGTLEFQAPKKPGSYDFRMNNGGRETGSETFTVK